MNLKEWIRATRPEKRKAICDAIGTTPDYLWQIAGGHSRPSARLAIAIERETGVCRQKLRPDIFFDKALPTAQGEDRAA
ncbi:MAG: helix-turn-helix domain-containing protein [Candidatus Contendobacter sp.]|jgi:DNA-binding transcriptional regulator YdaS (Cro superfamily)|nr:helix-turn-helix domain-containing protein [Candidatus Contendobacter sp.]